ncbi:helix-turn-helix domain-containing protein [Aquimarina rhabdastrellae]
MTGEFLKEKIKSSGFQQVEVAAKLGISPQSLESKLKSKDIKVSFLLKVAKAINQSIYYFLDELDNDFFIKNYLNPDEDTSKASKAVTSDILGMVSEEIFKKLNSTEDYIQVITEAQTRSLVNQDTILDLLQQLITSQKKSSEEN